MSDLWSKPWSYLSIPAVWVTVAFPGAYRVGFVDVLNVGKVNLFIAIEGQNVAKDGRL
jgi:hypothetical protein